MRLFSRCWLWLEVGVLLASIAPATEAASLDVRPPAPPALLRDAYGEARTIRHRKGLMTQQLSPRLHSPPGGDRRGVSVADASSPETGSQAAADVLAAAAAAAPAVAAFGEMTSGRQQPDAATKGERPAPTGKARNGTPAAGGGGGGGSESRSSSFGCKEGQVACPTANKKPSIATAAAQCVAIQSLCNGSGDCSGGEDEDPVMCMFYKQIYVDLNVRIKNISSQLQKLTHYVNQHRHDAEGHVIRPTV